MNKADLAKVVAIKAGISNAAAGRIVNQTLETILEAVAANEQIRLKGFGTFLIVHKRARASRNPRTGATIQVPAKAVVKFRPSKILSV